MNYRISFLKGYFSKGIKFLIVGGVNTAGTYALYVGLLYLGLHYNVALAFEYIVGIIAGYTMNRYWTFASHTPSQQSFLKYCATYGVVYILNVIFLNFLVAMHLLGPAVGQIVALGAATIVSFFFQNFWVFRHKDVTKQQHKNLHDIEL